METDSRHLPKRPTAIDDLRLLYRVGLVVVGGAAVLTGLCALSILVIASGLVDDNQFLRGNHCHTESPIYRAIAASAPGWNARIPLPQPDQEVPAPVSFDITTETGATYTATAEYWTTQSRMPIVYVPVYGLGSMGRSGFFYTPSGELPAAGVRRYVPVAGAIYCYRAS